MDAIVALQHGFAPALALALMHSVWQGALLALTAACALAAMRRSSASLRHAVAMGFLAAMVLVPLAGFVKFWSLPAGQINDGWLPTMTMGESPGVAGVFVRESSALPGVIVLLWLFGVALMLLRHAGGLWAVRSMERASRVALPPAWGTRVERLRVALGIARSVVVHVSQDIAAPCAARVLRPVIWLPASLLARMPADQLEALLAHELAHIARMDWLWNGLQCALEALLFFHPAAWWLGRRIRQEREHACDDLAVAACGDAIALAEALAFLQCQRQSAPRLVLAANGGSLMQRIKRILSAPSARSRWERRIVLGVVLAGGSLIAAQAAFSGNWQPEMQVYSTTEGVLGPGDTHQIEANGVGGRRVYRAHVDADGQLIETYERNGQSRQIDAGVRRWLAEVGRLSDLPPLPPPPPPPPASQAPPPPPPVPDVKASAQFKALMQLIVADPRVMATLGTPVSPADDPVSGSLSLEDEQGDADLRFKLKGPKGVAGIHLVADMSDGVWSMVSMDLD